MSITDTKPGEGTRSSKWPKVRAKWLKEHGSCAVCGRVDALEVHHKRPFHLHPDLELDPTNFVTLCEHPSDGNDHFCYGHLRSWQSWNEIVEEDAASYFAKLKNRP